MPWAKKAIKTFSESNFTQPLRLDLVTICAFSSMMPVKRQIRALTRQERIATSQDLAQKLIFNVPEKEEEGSALE